MTEYEFEPIRGLPGDLPPGERIIWQGAPNWRTFSRTALFTRWIAGYFLLLGVIAAAQGSLFGIVMTASAAVVVVGLLNLFALMVARTTVYTLTNRRLVLRIGVALNTCVNLPLAMIGSAEFRDQGGGVGDIALDLTDSGRLGYAMLWPHARPFKFGSPQPMLRALPDAAAVAALLARACADIVPNKATAMAATAGAGAGPLREAAA